VKQGEVVRKRNVRIVAGAVTAVAALALTGCSSDGDKSDKETGATAPAASSAPEGGGSADGTSGSTDGVWSAKTDGQQVVLVIGAKQASLSTADGHLCSGTLSDGAKPTLLLKCADGSTDRTTGAIESNDGTTMKISWDAGKNDTFTKSENGKIPGLPSGLPSDLPTG
jgi:hypothetical protein